MKYGTIVSIKKIFFNVYLFLRQRETKHEWGRVRERGKHRIWSRLQALSCQHRARCRARTHGPWDNDLSRSRTLNRLSHPGSPVKTFLSLRSEERRVGKECVRAKGRHIIWSRLQALSCQHRAQRGAPTLVPQGHDQSQSPMFNRLSHPGAPIVSILNKNLWW